jgi:hypothetical protein
LRAKHTATIMPMTTCPTTLKRRQTLAFATLSVSGSPSPWHSLGTPIAFDNGQLAAFFAPDGTAFSPQLWVIDGTRTQELAVSCAPNGLDRTNITLFGSQARFDPDPGPSY